MNRTQSPLVAMNKARGHKTGRPFYLAALDSSTAVEVGSVARSRLRPGPSPLLVVGAPGRSRWAHIEFTRISTTPTILSEKIEHLRETAAQAEDRMPSAPDCSYRSAPCYRRLSAVRALRPTYAAH